MNKDIYKKGLILLSIIVIVLITIFGYIIEKNKDEAILPVAQEQPLEDSNVAKEKAQEATIIVIDIDGAVKKPGVYELKDGMRVNDAIDIAGGFTEDVNSEYVSKYINKARILQDEEKLYIPKIGEDISIIENNSNLNNDDNTNLAGGKININTANKNQLITLKGIGESFAQRIIDYRKDKKFNSIDEIKNIKGIGDKTFEQIKDYITVE